MFVENLEDRCLFAGTATAVPPITLTDAGSLYVVGTARDDYITVRPAKGKVVVTVRTFGRPGRPDTIVSRKFNPAKIKQIFIDGLHGNDFIKVELPKFRGDTHLDGQAGDDYLAIETNGRGFLNGGPGNDALTGANKNDELNGGPGADGLYGMGGNDTLIGGPGRDAFVGGPGNDELRARDGENDATFFGDKGQDTAYTDDPVLEFDLRGTEDLDYFLPLFKLATKIEDVRF
jgi:Ca2+-binding RTX toxin-like protein